MGRWQWLTLNPRLAPLKCIGKTLGLDGDYCGGVVTPVRVDGRAMSVHGFFVMNSGGEVVTWKATKKVALKWQSFKASLIPLRMCI